MGVVDEIILNKKEIIKKEKDKKSLFEIKKEAEDKVSTIDNSFRFLEEFKKNDYTKIIAEFKPASPSITKSFLKTGLSVESTAFLRFERLLLKYDSSVKQEIISTLT